MRAENFPKQERHETPVSRSTTNSKRKQILFKKNTKTFAAKSLQLCLTLCNPIDSSPSGSPVLGILQARTLEWVAISFSTHLHYLSLNDQNLLQLFKCGLNSSAYSRTRYYNSTDEPNISLNSQPMKFAFSSNSQGFFTELMPSRIFPNECLCNGFFWISNRCATQLPCAVKFLPSSSLGTNKS